MRDPGLCFGCFAEAPARYGSPPLCIACQLNASGEPSDYYRGRPVPRVAPQRPAEARAVLIAGGRGRSMPKAEARAYMARTGAEWRMVSGGDVEVWRRAP